MKRAAGLRVLGLGSMPKTVSVHIVTFHSDKYIEACLEAVLKQTYPIERIIVVDNASTDLTKTILERFREQIELISNESNMGFALAHNQAIGASSTDFALVLNPDIQLDRDYVLHLVEAIEAQPRAGSATGKLVRSQEIDKIDSTGLVINRARRAFDRGANEPALNWNGSSVIFGVSAAAALYSRAMIEDISMDGDFFDTDFFAYKEDVDVAWRAQLLGWNAYYEPRAIALHERGWKSGGRMEQPIFVRRLSYINRYKMMVKNDSWGYIFVHLIPLLANEVMSFGYAVLKEPELLAAWGDFIRKLPALLRKRRLIRTKRKVELQQVYRWFK